MDMSFAFHEFRFDRRGLRLSRQGRPVDLRPKVALLLECLLERRDRLLAKDELIRSVWGHSHVEDQALFQLISELRATLGDKDCVRTYPNRGYQWTWPVRPVDDRRAGPPAWRLATAFSLAVAALGLVLLLGRFTAVQQGAPITAVSPAVDALARAVEARAQGDLERAADYLETAIVEHPRFASAKLEMAETLRLQGRLIAAQGYAYDALSDARISGDDYMEVAAHLLLSRLRWQQGDFKGAVEFNSTAGEMARERQFICAAELSHAMGRLLVEALTRSEAAPAPPTLAQQSLLAGCNRSSQWLDGASSETTGLLSSLAESGSISGA